MSELFELKEYIKRIYAKNESYITPLLKFLLSFILLATINAKVGYMEKIDNILVVLVAALFCSFMPVPTIAIVAAAFLVLHYYALAFECAIVVLAMLIVMFLLYIRLVPEETLIIIVTPILFALQIPYLLPVVVGLLGGPVSIISVSFAVAISWLIEYTAKNETTISAMTADVMTAKLRFMLDGLIGNDAMVIMIIAFAVTLMVVYFIRKSSMDHAWTVAIIAGILTDIVILMMGDLIFDLEYSILGIIFGSLVATLICFVVQFFAFHLDYSRTEKVQFEDDEYYYYVKAVPKICVATPDKKVKKIYSNRGTVPRGNTPVRKMPHSSSSSDKKEYHKEIPSSIKTAHGVTRTTAERQRHLKEEKVRNQK